MSALSDKIGENGGGPIANGGVQAGPLKHPMLAGNTELQRAATGERAFQRNLDSGEPVGIIQDALDRLLPPADRINAGANRGALAQRWSLP